MIRNDIKYELQTGLRNGLLFKFKDLRELFS